MNVMFSQQMQGAGIGIRKFIFEEQMSPGMCILTYGKTWCGKTWVTSDFLSKMQSYGFQFGRCFYGSPASRKMFRRYVPDEFIMEPTETLLAEQLEKAVRRAEAREEQGLDPEPNFIFSDDCAFVKEFMRCGAMSKLMSAGRNYGITRLHVIQKLTYALPEMRSGADIFATAWINEEPIRREVWKMAFSTIPTFKQFEAVLSEATKDFGFLCVNMRIAARSRDWRECVSWYRVEEDPTCGPPVELLPHNMYVISKLRKTKQAQELAQKRALLSSNDAAVAVDSGKKSSKSKKSDEVMLPIRLDGNGDIYELPPAPLYNSIIEGLQYDSPPLPFPDWKGDSIVQQ
jgi:ADP-ribose pyrophosphatase YjhB (NUDIX family)